MPSYVQPNVDHNLWGTMIPQFPLEQVMQLAGHRQAMYNAGAAQAQNNVASMLSMENHISSELMKKTVNQFNKDANDKIKKYSTLDFSVSGNVDAINSVYDPLMNDKYFMADYSSTLHYEREMKKALSYRDSTKKDMNDKYNETNLRDLMYGITDLRGANTLEDILKGSEKARNSRYTPYVDYKKTIRDLVTSEDFFIQESTTPQVDSKGNFTGRMVTYKGIKYDSMNAFLQANMTDKELNQIALEGRVGFNDAYYSSGQSKDEFSISTIGNLSEDLQKGINVLQEDINKKVKELNTYKDDDKLNPKKLAEKKGLEQIIDTQQQVVNKRSKDLEEYNNTLQKYSNGEISGDRLYSSLESAYSQKNIYSTIDQMAASYANFKSTDFSKDEALFAKLSESRLERRLGLDVQKHNDDMAYKYDQMKLDYFKEGYQLDENGNPINLTGQQANTTYTDPTADDLDTFIEHFPDVKSLNDVPAQIRKEKRENNSTLISEFAGIVGKDFLAADNQKLKSFLNTIQTTPNLSLNDLQSIDGYEQYNKLITELEIAPKSVNDIFTSIASQLDSKVANGTATDKEKRLYTKWSVKDIENTIALESNKRHKRELIDAFNNQWIKDKSKYNKVVNGDTPIIIDDEGNIAFNETKRTKYDAGFGSIFIDRRKDKEEIKEYFEEFMTNSENLKGVLQGFAGRTTANGSQATQIAINKMGQYNANLSNSYFNEEDIDPGFMKGTTAYDIDNDGDVDEMKFVNAIMRLAVDESSNKAVTNFSNKNQSWAIRKITESPIGDRLYFSRNYLDQLVGKADVTGSEIKEFSGFAGFDVSQTKELLDVIYEKGMLMKSAEFNSTVRNSSLDYLKNNGVIPITAPSTDMSLELIMNDESENIIDVYVKNLGDNILFNPSSTYSMTDGNFVSNNVENSNRLDSYAISATGGLSLENNISSLLYQADLNNYVMSEDFIKKINIKIKNGEIKADKIPFKVIESLYNSQ